MRDDLYMFLILVDVWLTFSWRYFDFLAIIINWSVFFELEYLLIQEGTKEEVLLMYVKVWVYYFDLMLELKEMFALSFAF